MQKLETVAWRCASSCPVYCHFCTTSCSSTRWAGKQAEERCWNNVHGRDGNFNAQKRLKTERGAKRKASESPIESRLFFLCFVIIIPLPSINLINFHHFNEGKESEENFLRVIRRAQAQSVWGIFLPPQLRRQHRMNWCKFITTCDAEFFPAFFSKPTLQATTNHRNVLRSMLRGAEVFKGEGKGTSGRWEKFERLAFMNKLICKFCKHGSFGWMDRNAGKYFSVDAFKTFCVIVCEDGVYFEF